MECKAANNLMMKYMDEVLSEDEAAALNSHIILCKVCKEDFLVYETMITEFDKQSAYLYEPPLGFEDEVMEKISGLTPDYCKVYSQDSVLGFVLGAFSMLFGFGVILSVYQNEIMAMGAKYPYLGTIMNGASLIADRAVLFANELTRQFLFYFNNANALIDSFKYGILAIVIALVAAQLFVYQKNVNSPTS